MNQELFEMQHKDEWLLFEGLLKGIRQKSIHSEDLYSFPKRYRRICKQLALARERCYSMVIVDRLNQLVLEGHHLLYLARGGSFALFVHFVFVRFPCAVRRELPLVLLCGLLFYGPLLASILAIHLRPEFVYSIISPEQVFKYEEMYAGPDALKRDAGSDLQMFGFYIFNNVGIGFRTFSSGILAGLGSAFFLIFNGLMIGAVMGHMTNVPFWEVFFTFVIGHSAFELNAIVLSGVAGLRLGMALVFPGSLSRREALKKAGRTGIVIVFGMAGMLALAAVLEAFWSPRNLIPWVKYSVGGFLWLLTFLYFGFAGRGHEN